MIDLKIELIRLFNKALKGNDYDYNEIVKAGAAAGYIVHPDCTTNAVMGFLKDQKINPNSTFYATWNDVVSRNREQLFAEQTRHYATTFGSITKKINPKDVYIQNTNEQIDINYFSYKYIMAATAEEIFEDCNKLLKSGIALSAITIDAIVYFIIENNFIDKVFIDEIKNKEAKAIIASKLNKMPSDEFDLLRTIVYNYTQEALLIKSREICACLENRYDAYNNIDLSALSEDQLKSLSKIFYRFKPLFLSLKKNNNNNSYYVNKIRRYAKKYHKPFKASFWERCLSVRNNEVESNLLYAKENIDSITNFKKIQLMQAINARIANSKEIEHFYTIRNGKQFIRNDYEINVDESYLGKLYDIIKQSVINSLKSKATSYCCNDNVHLAAPTSEKNFIGNYPIGTYIDFSKSDNVLGIYWRNEWGTHDYDLHLCDINGNNIGWNANFILEDNKVIYSGDMTNADPEATELMYFQNMIDDAIVYVNKFNGATISKFKLFIAKEDCYTKLSLLKEKYNYNNNKLFDSIMVDPNNINFEAMIDFNGPSNQLNIGYIHNKRLYLIGLKSGYSRVSNYSECFSKLLMKTNNTKAESYIDLESLLKEAGFTKAKVADLDFNNPSKEKIISLFVDN